MIYIAKCDIKELDVRMKGYFLKMQIQNMIR